MSHLINTLEKIGSNSKLKTTSAKPTSERLHSLGISPLFANLLANKNGNKLAKLTHSRVNMCCFIMRAPTTLEVFDKPLNNKFCFSSDYIPYCKSVA